MKFLRIVELLFLVKLINFLKIIFPLFSIEYILAMAQHQPFVHQAPQMWQSAVHLTNRQSENCLAQ